MSHPTPMRKKDFYKLQHRIGLPYPNYGIDIDELPVLCRCYVEKGTFYVTHQQDVPTLYRNGCFGHSSITNRSPLCLLQTSHEKKFYYQKLREWKGKEKQVGDTRNIEVNGNIGNMETLPAKSASNGITEKDYEIDKFILLPEEVIFLSFGVGCLSIHDGISSEMIGYHDVWKSLVQNNPEFPFIYAVYHYFRSKNWVPKSGVQFGGDYVLYQLGPDFYHSTYVVYIVGLPSRPKLTWNQVHALERVALATNKTILLCEVDIPKLFAVTSSTPQSIFDIRIRETVIGRWTPFGSQSHEEED